ncbi:MAG: ABC transporter ATP-binding protein [Clostridiales bacterium]|nr:ABC transporter ATP-binding protein [Clostridiales bacterium]
MIKRFAKYYKPHIALFTADMICAFILALCDLFYPMITRNMMGNLIPNNNIRMLLVWAAVLLGVYLLKLALNYFVNYYGHMVGVRMQADMRREVFDHLQKLPLTYFDNNKTGTIMSRIISDLFDISELAHHGPEDLFLSLIILIGAFIMMAGIYLPMALIVFAAIPIMILFAGKKRMRMSETSKASRVEIGEVNAGLENSIAGIRVSKAYTNAEYENRTFSEGNERFVRVRGKAYKVMAEFIAGTNFIGDALNVILYVAGGLFCLYGKITLADFTAFVLYISVFMTPVKRLIGFVEQYQNGITGFERFTEIMDYPAETDSNEALDLENVKGEIEFESVYFAYEDSQEILHGLSFRIEQGKTMALVGPSGGGKTTICHLIPRFYDVTGGAVRIDGQDVRNLTISSLRKNIGIVAQDVFLFNATIYDNIAYGCPGASREQVEDAAKRANIYDYIISLEKGLETVVGERGVKLSGGQKQRISIARAFLKDPKILILDEATSALDNVSEMMIQKSLDELCSGRTTVVVAHRLTTVKNADEILVVTDEGIAERGSHEELLKQGGIYAGLWQGAEKNR